MSLLLKQTDHLILEASLEATLNVLQFHLQNPSLSAEEKLLRYTELISHKWKDLWLGSLVGIYTLIKYNEVSLSLLMHCLNEVFKALVNFEM